MKLNHKFGYLQMFWVCLIIILGVVLETQAQYEDTRCKCVCPDLKNGTATSRKLYISPATKCTCDNVVIPQVEKLIQGKVEEFCSRCECKYESRNTAIIQRVVILVIGIVSLLMTYMLFLMCLDPLLNKRIKQQTAYQEHTNEDDESVGGSRAAHSLRMTGVVATSQGPAAGSPANVLNRVGNQQNKWKRQVQEQRRNIYDRHTILN